MKKLMLSVLFLAASALAHEGELVEQHSVLEIIAESPVVVAWVATLVVLAILAFVFWFISRKEEMKTGKNKPK